jgi:hypothetical protein
MRRRSRTDATAWLFSVKCKAVCRAIEKIGTECSKGEAMKKLTVVLLIAGMFLISSVSVWAGSGDEGPAGRGVKVVIVTTTGSGGGGEAQR